MDVNLYRYFIGRGDQSVNEKVMISRIDQQLRVNKLMVDYYDADKIKEPKLDKYMVQYVTMVTGVSSILALKSGTEENLQKREELFNYIKTNNPVLYKKMKKHIVGSIIEWKNPIGKKTLLTAYKVAQKIFAFN